jgi:NAD(P)-dependent dehydrogenase (short-subunit alcohol dehydrogenase family)
MGLLDGRIVIVTGAGRGLGRAHALEVAGHGACVVVSDVDAETAALVAKEINDAGGTAVARTADVSCEPDVEDLVACALTEFGDLHAVVNNAGILRDKMLVNMTVAEWDSVISVHLRGTFLVTRAAARYWRERSKAGEQVSGRIVNTTSAAGLYGNIGQANYGAAKAGIATFTIIAAEELGRYGVTVNALSPNARTRMTEELFADAMTARHGEFDVMNPANASPLVAWLCSTESGDVTGYSFTVRGSRLWVNEGWHKGPSWDAVSRWTVEKIWDHLHDLTDAARPATPVLGTAASGIVATR